MRMMRFVLAAAMSLATLTHEAEAQAQEPLRLLVSNGLKASMEKLQPQAEAAVGRKLSMEFNSTAGLRAKIEAGERFDGAFITTEAIAELIKQGKAAAGSRTAIGRSPLVIGIRAGSPRADIRTNDTLKQAFLQAKSITFPRDGASRAYIEKVFAQLGIAAAVQPKVVLAVSSGTATESVAKGEHEMVLTLASETAPVPGVEVLGPMPGALAFDIHFDGAASSSTTQAEAVRKLLAFLRGTSATAVFRANGVEAPAGK